MTIPIKPTVLIIGCGPAGLGAIEQFLRKGFYVVAYEARDAIGGLWSVEGNYDPNPPPCTVSFDKQGHAVALTKLERQGKPAPSPTPMYAGVTANTPRDIMPYRSHPYPEGTVEYPTYKTIYQYQQRFADKYTDYIRLNRVVTRVRHVPDGHPAVKRWVIEWTPSYTSNSPDIGKAFEEQFDHVVVANGTDSRPFMPYIDGLWNWKGEILHSRWYRTPEAFAGKTVMIVGGGPSSADLVREIGMLKVNKSPSQPKKIYRSFRSKLRYDTELEAGWPEHINNVSPMKILEGPSEHSKTGRITTVLEQVIDDVDVIIFATGFVARFEFFKDTDAPFNGAPLVRYPQVSEAAAKPPLELVGEATLEGGHRVHNLDSHQLFYLPDPTLPFLLLHAEAIPWPFSEMQARVVASYWTGTPLELIPHSNEDNDSHSVLVLGHPGEFEYAEGLLKLIGEGGPEEVDSQGRWGAWPEWKRHIRALID
ncbi:hypothetical protein I204_06941 [Kwoniella mangroviensis CBS 8886]|nr:hypothetical protein I204_06941 [Kwoniella mangroviensis CBS 8886]